jgi:hypothetical protein
LPVKKPEQSELFGTWRRSRQTQKGGIGRQAALKSRACKALAAKAVPFCAKEEQWSGTKNPEPQSDSGF